MFMHKTLNKRSMPLLSSAAFKNFKLAVVSLAIGLVLAVMHVPWYIFTAFFAVSGGFLMTMASCVLDIQEHNMRQLQSIAALLMHISESIDKMPKTSV